MVNAYCYYYYYYYYYDYDYYYYYYYYLGVELHRRGGVATDRGEVRTAVAAAAQLGEVDS